MERLWAPWRNVYVSSSDADTTGCVFCDQLAQENDEENHIVLRASHVFVILNAYPYTSGHVMVVPYQHTGDFTAVVPETLAEMMSVAQRTVRVLEETMHPQAFNVGMNIGRSAGAGIADHVHLHVVPRWSGDTNFMTSLSETRVLSQSLQESYQQIRQGFDKVQ